MVVSKIAHKKRLYKPVLISFCDKFCYINGFLSESKFKLKTNQLFALKKGYFIVHKKYVRTFFTLLWREVEGMSHGFKVRMAIRGKGLRLQLKYINGKICIYLKLGYSHKIFLHLPKNCWAKIFRRRRSIKLYALNYVLLRNLVLKIRRYYPLGLYKVRGFFVEGESIKIIAGKSRLTSSLGYYG